jgi:hypothetical protein
MFCHMHTGAMIGCIARISSLVTDFHLMAAEPASGRDFSHISIYLPLRPTQSSFKRLILNPL